MYGIVCCDPTIDEVEGLYIALGVSSLEMVRWERSGGSIGAQGNIRYTEHSW